MPKAKYIGIVIDPNRDSLEWWNVDYWLYEYRGLIKILENYDEASGKYKKRSFFQNWFELVIKD